MTAAQKKILDYNNAKLSYQTGMITLAQYLKVVGLL